MAIFSRIVRLCRSDMHGVMDQLEDKSLLLKQYLREMEDGLKEKKTRLEAIAANVREAQRDLDVRRQGLDQLETDLDLAVAREKDDIARMLIRKRRTLEAGCVRLQHQLARWTEEQGRLGETLEKQTLQYEQLKAKAAAFHQHADQKRNEAPDVFDDAELQWASPTEEEIELELLQRKESLKPGGDV